MIIYVFNKSLEIIGMIEDYYSLTWAERYSVCGDFELELPISYAGSPLVEFGNFLSIPSSETIMIIEDIKPSTGEDKTNLVIKGESTESLLRRRVIEEPTSFNQNPADLIYGIVEYNLIIPHWEQPERGISILTSHYEPHTIVGLYKEQVDVQSVYKIVVAICKDFGIGFKIRKGDNELLFTVYEGVDRSYDQTVNPFVIFSDDFDNVISSSFYLSEKGKINMVRAYTEDSFASPTGLFIWEEGASEPEDLDRFEGVLNTEVNPDLDPVWPLSAAEVLAIIESQARAVIKENKTVGVFEGDFDIEGNFKYGVDFFMGDIVQCKLEGRNLKARIIELVRSYSTEGETSYVAMDFIV